MAEVSGLAATHASENVGNRPTQWDPTGSVAWGLACLVLLWTLVGSWGHTALHQDMAEQFVWAHSWQWSYPKHPPLPTWLFLAAQQLFSPTPAVLYGLAGLCFATAGVFTFLFAKELWGLRWALLAALLWGLQQPFSWRAWIYNHNSVLVAAVALTAWACVRVAKQGSWGRWLLLSVVAALSMLTKFQALVPLLGMVWALWRSGALASRQQQHRLVAAMGLIMLLCAPVFYEMLYGHSNAVAYGLHQLHGVANGEKKYGLGQFVLSALRMASLTLVVLCVWIYAARRATRPSARHEGHAAEKTVPSPYAIAQPWIEGLVLWPLLVVLIVGLGWGASLHAQWGVPVFQFLALALIAWFAPRLEGLRLAWAAQVALGAQALMLLVAISPWGHKLHAQGAVMGYPAKELAQRVLNDWQRHTSCPLQYINAPFIEGGQLSAYLPGFQMVLEDGDFQKSPWVQPGKIEQAGSVVVATRESALPADALHEPSMHLMPPDHVKLVEPAYWAIRLPRQACPHAAGRNSPLN